MSSKPQEMNKKPAATVAASNASKPTTPASNSGAQSSSIGLGSPSTGHSAVVPLDAIRKRAYELYQRRISRGEAGSEASDWAQAEHELVHAKR